MVFRARPLRKLEYTLAILKPDITRMPSHVQTIRKTILDNGFQIARTKIAKLSRAGAEQFYAEHREKFFYNRLVSFMSSGSAHFHVLVRDDAITGWRSLLGPTKVFKARFEAPESIRGRYGISDTRNCGHGSDSDETAKREVEFVFPDFNAQEFYEKDSLKSLYFDEEKFVHRFK